jgi:hypothetical protein
MTGQTIMYSDFCPSVTTKNKLDRICKNITNCGKYNFSD